MPTAEQTRILIVGDNRTIIEGIADLLQMVGYAVAVLPDAMEMENAIDANPPNLIIIDLSLAILNGQHFEQEIYRVLELSVVPILFLSFSGDDRIRELQRHNRGNSHLHFYAHTLLSMENLLQTVCHCLSSVYPGT